MDQLPNATINPPSTTQKTSQSFSFSVDPSIPDSGNSEPEGSVNEVFPPLGTEGIDEFMITPVDDLRVKVVQIAEAPQFIDAVTGKSSPAPDVPEMTEHLRATDMQRWFDTMACKQELEASSDEILDALAFNLGPERIKADKEANNVDNLRLATMKVNNDLESRKSATLPTRSELRVQSI
ncbi:hypothetical protein L873DRAFT_245149 [Choiromyces venosus 120613-1]|uniref:Uncharacterized protein n=1 Tax=Choiromyces venosus 120613-1 TaxID=1336337 RepID=A0A3N4J4J4_9PEZI|nr:hypothetical protein L873DRAFT_245149 [Choiromyces venosus 120613-1]